MRIALALASLLALAGACNEPKGHASIVRCVDGKIRSMEIPLSELDDEPEFTACGDDGSCVPEGQSCPAGKPAATP